MTCYRIPDGCRRCSFSAAKDCIETIDAANNEIAYLESEVQTLREYVAMLEEIRSEKE